jgi:hypothetical protein
MILIEMNNIPFERDRFYISHEISMRALVSIQISFINFFFNLDQLSLKAHELVIFGYIIHFNELRKSNGSRNT